MPLRGYRVGLKIVDDMYEPDIPVAGLNYAAVRLPNRPDQVLAIVSADNSTLRSIGLAPSVFESVTRSSALAFCERERVDPYALLDQISILGEKLSTAG